MKMREVAKKHLLEQISANPQQPVQVGRAELLEQARHGDLVIVEVRPDGEHQAAHLPRARSMPPSELEKRIDQLLLDREIGACRRGPFCLLSEAAVELLAKRGFMVRKVEDGASEWLGLPVHQATAG